MIVNPDKFQAMILQNSNNSKNQEPVKLEIESAKIKTKNTVKLLGITIHAIKCNESFTKIHGQ